MIISFRTSTRVPILFLILLAMAAFGPGRLALAAKVEDRIVAIVNSDLIMLSEVKRELAPERERIERRYRGEELSRRLQMAEAMALTIMIERRLQLQEAKAKNVEVGDLEVKQAIKQLIQQGEKIDEKDPASTRSVRDQLTLLKVVDREVRSGVMVADPEMKRYYQEHRDRFALPEEYTLSQIFLKARSADDLDDAKPKAREIMTQIKQGESFEDLALRYSERGLAAIVLPQSSNAAVVAGLGPEAASSRRASSLLLLEAKKQLVEYLGGIRVSFDLPLDLSRGTAFQQHVWKTLQAIPYGQLWSYRGLASRVGGIQYARAVGRAVGANPLPIVVPCHRVVAQNATIGGFSCGLPSKRRLLALEGSLSRLRPSRRDR